MVHPNISFSKSYRSEALHHLSALGFFSFSDNIARNYLLVFRFKLCYTLSIAPAEPAQISAYPQPFKRIKPGRWAEDMRGRIKKRVYEILDKALADDVPSRIFDIFIINLIILNVFAVVLETVEDLSIRYGPLFEAFEIFSVAIFTVEYLLRLWSCTSDPQFSHPVIGRLRYSTSFFALVDLIAIAPFYLPMLIPMDLRFLRALRMARIFRLLKLGRYSSSIQTMGRVLRKKKEELLVLIFVMLLALVVSSSLMYFCEYESQPEAFSSIPAAMWWGVATLTTVGYGDIYPVTLLGKILGTVIAILGIGLFAVPAGILGSGFVEEVRRKKGLMLCPHCGKGSTERE